MAKAKTEVDAFIHACGSEVQKVDLVCGTIKHLGNLTAAVIALCVLLATILKMLEKPPWLTALLAILTALAVPSCSSFRGYVRRSRATSNRPPESRRELRENPLGIGEEPHVE